MEDYFFGTLEELERIIKALDFYNAPPIGTPGSIFEEELKYLSKCGPWVQPSSFDMTQSMLKFVVVIALCLAAFSFFFD